MVATRPTPGWVTRLRRHCNPDERLALDAYRNNVARAHTRHRKAQLDHTQVVRIWADALDKLADQAQGTPQLTAYREGQRKHLETFATELPQAPKTGRESEGGTHECP